MKLLQLEYFCAACRFGNITKASQALHISQPAITSAIKELENEFGVTLISRKSRGFTLSYEGELLLRRAESLLEQADTLRRTMQEAGKNRKLLRLGVPPMVGTCFFPEIYKSFHISHPEIHFTTQEDGSENLLEALNAGLLDILILPLNALPNQEYHVLPFAKT
ncbi:MAG: LysR family transcriptional regulator, partial [Oscillospiraceae bacterium]